MHTLLQWQPSQRLVVVLGSGYVYKGILNYPGGYWPGIGGGGLPFLRVYFFLSKGAYDRTYCFLVSLDRFLAVLAVACAISLSAITTWLDTPTCHRTRGAGCTPDCYPGALFSPSGSLAPLSFPPTGLGEVDQQQ